MPSSIGEPSRTTARSLWWKGTHGEWYVAGQVVLIALVLFGPRTWPDGALLPIAQTGAWPIVALVLIVAGVALLVAGGIWLGACNITPLPYPREQGRLVDSGPYGLVRHPMYSGGIFIAFGWTIWVRGPLTLLYALALLVFADVKSRREERWLRAKFPGYVAYQHRVHRLIPFLY